MTWSQMIKDQLGYETKTTFWDDFTIADRFGEAAIVDTYNRAFKEWHNNVEYITELVLVLNHKIWQWYQNNQRLSELYDRLWDKTHEWCIENLSGDDLAYYLQTVD